MNQFSPFNQTPLKVSMPAADENSFKTQGWSLSKAIVGEGEDPELWAMITAGLCDFDDAFATACKALGYPAACLTMDLKDIHKGLVNHPAMAIIKRNLDNNSYDRLLRELHHRLCKLKKIIEAKEVPKDLQESMMRLNSYKDVPVISQANLPVSLANIKRYIEKNKVPQIDYTAVYKKGASNEEEVRDIEAFEQWLKTQTPMASQCLLSSLEQVNCCLIRKLDKNYKDMTYITLLANLRPNYQEDILHEYSRRFIDHWKITTLSSKEAGDAFQAGLPKHMSDAIIFAGLNNETFEAKLEYLKQWKTTPQQHVSLGNRMSRPLVADRIAPQFDNIVAGEKRKFTGRCNKCQKRGHKEVDCKARNRVNPYPAHKPQVMQQGSKNTGTGKQYSTFAYSNKMNKDELNNYSQDPSFFLAELQAIHVPNVTPVKYITKEVYLNDKRQEAMIDTGASNCFMTRTVWEELQIQSDTLTDAVSIQYANEELSTGFSVKVPFHYKAYYGDTTFIVVDKLTHPVIIGLDLIYEIPQLLNYEPTIPSSKIKELLKEFKANPITIQEQEAVKYYSEKDSLMKLIKDSLLENLETIDKKSTIGEIAIHFKNEKDRRKGLWRPQMPLSKQAMQFYKKQVDEWLEEGVIEPMIDLKGHYKMYLGAFNINAFYIFSSKERIVHNFKALNTLIEDDTNIIPGINDAFNKIAGAKPVIYTKIDLKSAYLQVPLREDDRSICAFTCDGIRYRFITAPLGLKVIPSQFQRWLKALLQKFGCSSYTVNHLDDIIIYSTSVEEHVTHVRQVLKALTSVNLTVNEKKCIWFATQLPVLGFWLQTNGIRPNLTKICNMLEWTRPTTRKEVQRLLGIINFFRRFIPNISDLLHPIMQIRAKNFVWEQVSGAEQAYQDVYKALMSSKAFLHFPVEGIEFDLHTDASNTAIAATLSQVVDGERRYLGYHSRVLQGSEVNYSVPKKELLSIVFHTKYYRDYLQSGHFNLYTDANSLCSILQRLQNPKGNSVLVSWTMELTDFDFSVHHIAGKDNTLPDLGSRIQAIHITEQQVNDTVQKNNNVTNEQEWTPERIQELLEKVHKLGHWGANIMYKYIRYTLGHKIHKLLDICKKFVENCGICLRVNNYYTAYAPVRIPKIYLPMEQVHIDLAEMDESNAGYKYILVAIDRMSGFVLLRRLKTKTMEEVTKKLEAIFSDFGYPCVIRSDNGSEFVNKLVSELNSNHKVVHQRIIPGNHQANGYVERAIRTVRTVLNKFRRVVHDGDFMQQWEELLPFVQYVMNNRVHSILNATPFSLMFGRSFFNSPTQDNVDMDQSRNVWAEFWNIFKHYIPEQVQQVRYRDQRQRKYNRKVASFKVGDMVMHATDSAETGNKRDDHYEGPYRIIGIKPDGNYVLDLGNGKRYFAPTNFLKRAGKRFRTGELYQKEDDEDDHASLAGEGSADENDVPQNSMVTQSKDSADENEALQTSITTQDNNSTNKEMIAAADSATSSKDESINNTPQLVTQAHTSKPLTDNERRKQQRVRADEVDEKNYGRGKRQKPVTKGFDKAMAAEKAHSRSRK